MRNLTDIAFKKMTQFYLDSLDYALYDLDGTEQRIEFHSKEAINNFVQVSIFFDFSCNGVINNIRVIDKDGDVVAIDSKEYKDIGGKALYIAFKHYFSEV